VVFVQGELKDIRIYFSKVSFYFDIPRLIGQLDSKAAFLANALKLLDFLELFLLKLFFVTLC